MSANGPDLTELYCLPSSERQRGSREDRKRAEERMQLMRGLVEAIKQSATQAPTKNRNNKTLSVIENVFNNTI
ncbi:hypothetical protein DPMN_023504 [Dreissena polymorpha]|uniref:Uncharacterized protein n=1 Tax=Dreissena polymorpha TaxID=45954 RepID=A0A9D4RBU5_DREPO|nr:hypothetical protein DPMN_023450 [Dreissena polymorpha]KAH3860595.1 hypothetical protein DPMN_023504 [Dreissena polymorpha]